MLRTCVEQLYEIFQYIFFPSLLCYKEFLKFGQNQLVPVAKTRFPQELNDFRPVALTSLVMKCLEKVVKDEILQQSKDSLDPLQFAFRQGRGVEDANLTLLSYLLSHLERPKTHARLLFIDLSSTFNTIKSHLMVEKLISHSNLDLNISGWIWLNFNVWEIVCVHFMILWV